MEFLLKLWISHGIVEYLVKMWNSLWNIMCKTVWSKVSPVFGMTLWPMRWLATRKMFIWRQKSILLGFGSLLHISFQILQFNIAILLLFNYSNKCFTMRCIWYIFHFDFCGFDRENNKSIYKSVCLLASSNAVFQHNHYCLNCSSTSYSLSTYLLWYAIGSLRLRSLLHKHIFSQPWGFYNIPLKRAFPASYVLYYCGYHASRYGSCLALVDLF